MMEATGILDESPREASSAAGKPSRADSQRRLPTSWVPKIPNVRFTKHGTIIGKFDEAESSSTVQSGKDRAVSLRTDSDNSAIKSESSNSATLSAYTSDATCFTVSTTVRGQPSSSHDHAHGGAFSHLLSRTTLASIPEFGASDDVPAIEENAKPDDTVARRAHAVSKSEACDQGSSTAESPKRDSKYTSACRQHQAQDFSYVCPAAGDQEGLSENTFGCQVQGLASWPRPQTKPKLYFDPRRHRRAAMRKLGAAPNNAAHHFPGSASPQCLRDSSHPSACSSCRDSRREAVCQYGSAYSGPNAAFTLPLTLGLGAGAAFGLGLVFGFAFAHGAALRRRIFSLVS